MNCEKRGRKKNIDYLCNTQAGNMSNKNTSAASLYSK